MAPIDRGGSSRREGGSLLSPVLAGGLAAAVVAYVIVAAVAGEWIGLAVLGALTVVATATARIGAGLARAARADGPPAHAARPPARPPTPAPAPAPASGLIIGLDAPARRESSRMPVTSGAPTREH